MPDPKVSRRSVLGWGALAALGAPLAGAGGAQAVPTVARPGGTGPRGATLGSGDPVATLRTGLPRQVFDPAASFWYKRLPANAPLDAQSAQHVELLIQEGIKGWGNKTLGYPSWTLNNVDNTPSVLVVDNNTPVANGGAGMTLRDTGKGPYFDNLRTMFRGVRIPHDAVVAAGGTDTFLIVYNVDTDTYWDFWQVGKNRPGHPGWSAVRGHRIQNASTKDGVAERHPGGFIYGSNAAGLAEEGGLIKAQELLEGNIPHVISFAAPINVVAHKTRVGISLPAVRSDGASMHPHAIQMGQRLRLPASLDLDAYTFHPVTRTVARCFQEYGAILNDRAGAISFRAENRSDLPAGTYGPILKGASPHNVMWNNGGYDPFPWSRLQVLAPDYLVP